MFQFLIGRLETIRVPAMRKHLRLFQFLIGRLETIVHTMLLEGQGKFQFLIGRLETKKLIALNTFSPCFNSS